jgi:hypothetical protein
VQDQSPEAAMLRLMLSTALLTALLSAGQAFADEKSDCMNGIAMIKTALKMKHPEDIRERVRKALASAENEVVENDWSECTAYINEARTALRK